MRRLIIAVLLTSVLARPQATLDRAATAAREKRYQDARQLLEGAPEPTATQQRIAFHRLKAAVASGLGNAREAAAEMRQARQLAPQDPALRLATAVAELKAAEPDTAPQAKVFLIQTWSALAVDLIATRKFRHAIDLLRQATTLIPDSARLRTILGIAQYSSADTEAAIATLTAAIALDPNETAAHQCLAQIVLRSSTAPAPAVIESLCHWNATVCSALELRVAREKDDPALLSKAIEGLRRAPQNDPVAHCELARAEDWSNRLPQARARMEACLALDPSPQNHYRLGLIYRRLGLTDLAKQQIEIRTRLLQTDSEEAAAGLTTIKRLSPTAP